MPKIAIPSADKTFQKPANGEIFGNLWATKNIDFDTNKGKIRLSDRFYRIFDSGDDADFEVPVSFVRGNYDGTDRWWCLAQKDAVSITDGLLFKTTDLYSGWTQDGIASTPTKGVSNMVDFNGALIVALPTDLARLTGSTWQPSWWISTLGKGVLSSTNTHHIYNFLNLLLVPDGRNIHTIDDSNVVTTSRITLPPEYNIRWIKDDGRMVYIGTSNEKGNEGLVFPWDGTSSTYGNPIKVGSHRSDGATIVDGILYVINGKGELRAYDGLTLKNVAEFPWVKMNKVLQKALPAGGPSTLLQQPIHPNGIQTIDDKVHILITSSVVDPIDLIGGGLENVVAGVWVFDPAIGLYQKYSLGMYDNVTNNAWGTAAINTVGALQPTWRGDQALNKGNFIAGAEVFTNVTTKVRAILGSQLENTANQRGYFITAQIQSSDVRAFWKKLQIVFKKLENSTDEIIIKYRKHLNRRLDVSTGDGVYGYSISMTWSDGNSLSGLTSSIYLTAIHNAVNTDKDDIEMTVRYGVGEGATAQISSSTLNGNNYDLEIDETVPNISNGETCSIIAMNWTRLGSITTDQTITEKLYTIAKRSPWIQLKIELRGTDTSPEIDKLLLEYNPKKR